MSTLSNTIEPMDIVSLKAKMLQIDYIFFGGVNLPVLDKFSIIGCGGERLSKSLNSIG
jgi:hypothetical protein